MRKYLALTKGDFMSSAVYRIHYLFIFVTNLLYIILIYSLWTAIYGGPDKVINGMTFNQVFIYLGLASSIFCLFQTYMEWEMSRNVINGNIVIDLIRPLDIQLKIMFTDLGFALSNLLAITLPSMLVITLVFKAPVNFGLNFIVFIIGVMLAYLISFNISFLMGLIAFYTQSIWGFFFAKETLVLLLSGATIPLQFYPRAIRTVVEMLPFQAIYNIPLTILISPGLTGNDYIRLLAVQSIWVVILFTAARFFYNKAVKVITINGG